MRVFVTGGTGFIGSHLVPKLVARGHVVRLLKTRLEKTDAVKRELHTFHPDAVIHLAWEGLESYDFPATTSVKNLTNSLSLISLAAEAGCKKFLSTGSCWEYGGGEGALKESALLLPATHVPDFVAAKRATQALGEQIALQCGMRFLWARLSFVYGPGQKERTLIAHTVKSIQGGTVPEVKNKEGANDFVYVGDVADALIALLEKSRQQSAIYNVGSGRLTPVARVVRETYHTLGIPAPQWSMRDRRPRGFYANITRIKKETGWKPKTPLATGVKKTVSYFKSL